MAACTGDNFLIILKANGNDGSKYPVVQQKLLIGSGDNCDIRINNPLVKNVHCSLIHDGAYTALQNFSIDEPVCVNGEIILENTVLHGGDIIKVGTRELRWVTNNKTPKAAKSPPKKVFARHSVAPVLNNMPRRLSSSVRLLESPLKKNNATPARRGSITENLESLEQAITPGIRTSQSVTVDSPAKKRTPLKTPKQVTKTPRSSFLVKDTMPQIEEDVECELPFRVSIISEEGEPVTMVSENGTTENAPKSVTKAIKSRIPILAPSKLNDSARKKTPAKSVNSAETAINHSPEIFQDTPMPEERNTAKKLLTADKENVGEEVNDKNRTAKRKLSLSPEKYSKRMKIEEQEHRLENVFDVGYQFSSTVVPKSFNFNQNNEVKFSPSSPITEASVSTRKSMRSSAASSNITSSETEGTTTDSCKESSADDNSPTKSEGFPAVSYLQNLSMISDDEEETSENTPQEYEVNIKEANLSPSKTAVSARKSNRISIKSEKESLSSSFESVDSVKIPQRATISDFTNLPYSDLSNCSPKSDLIDFNSDQDNNCLQTVRELLKSPATVEVDNVLEQLKDTVPDLFASAGSQKRISSRTSLNKLLNASEIQSNGDCTSDDSSSPASSPEKRDKTPPSKAEKSRRSSNLNISGIASLYSTPEAISGQGSGQRSPGRKTASGRRTPAIKTSVSKLRRIVGVKSLCSTPAAQSANKSLNFSGISTSPSSTAKKNKSSRKLSASAAKTNYLSDVYESETSSAETTADEMTPDEKRLSKKRNLYASSADESVASVSYIDSFVSEATQSTKKNSRSARRSKKIEDDVDIDISSINLDATDAQTPQSSNERARSARKSLKSEENLSSAVVEAINLDTTEFETPQSTRKSVRSARKSKQPQENLETETDADNWYTTDSDTSQSTKKSATPARKSERFVNSSVDLNNTDSKSPQLKMRDFSVMLCRESTDIGKRPENGNLSDISTIDLDASAFQTPQSAAKTNSSLESARKGKQLLQETPANMSIIVLGTTDSKTPQSALKNTATKSSRQSKRMERSVVFTEALGSSDDFQTPYSAKKHANRESARKITFTGENAADLSATQTPKSLPASATKNVGAKSARKSAMDKTGDTSNLNLSLLTNVGSSRKSRQSEKSLSNDLSVSNAENSAYELSVLNITEFLETPASTDKSSISMNVNATSPTKRSSRLAKSIANEDLEMPSSSVKDTSVRSSRMSKQLEKSVIDEDLEMASSPVKDTSARSSRISKKLEKSVAYEDLEMPSSSVKDTSVRSSRMSKQMEKSVIDEDLEMASSPVKDTSARSSRISKKLEKSVAYEDLEMPSSSVKDTSVRSSRMSKQMEKSVIDEDLEMASSPVQDTSARSSRISKKLEKSVAYEDLEMPSSSVKDTSVRSSRISKKLEKSVIDEDLKIASSPVKNTSVRSSRISKKLEKSVTNEDLEMPSSPVKDISVRSSRIGKKLEKSVTDEDLEMPSSPVKDISVRSSRISKKLDTTQDMYERSETLPLSTSADASVKSLRRNKQVQKSPENDLTNVRGVRALMKTPRVVKQPKNDLSDVRGVKSLMRTTPKVQKEPENDLTNVRGVKALMKTPRVAKQPKNDLSDVRGVKSLMRTTPKVQKEPENDLTNVYGVRALMKTPGVEKGPKNDLSDVSGVKSLMATPEVQTPKPSVRDELFDSLKESTPLRTYSNKKRSLKTATPAVLPNEPALSPRVDDWVEETSQFIANNNVDLVEDTLEARPSPKKTSKRSVTPAVTSETKKKRSRSSNQMKDSKSSTPKRVEDVDEEKEADNSLVVDNATNRRKSSRTPKKPKRFESSEDEKDVEARLTRSTRKNNKSKSDANEVDEKLVTKTTRRGRKVVVVKISQEEKEATNSKIAEEPKVIKRGKRSLEKSEEIIAKEQKTIKRNKKADVTSDAPNQEDEVITKRTTRRGKKPVVEEPKVTKRGKKSLEKSEEIVQKEQKTARQSKEADVTIDAPDQEDEVITQRTTRRGKKPVVEEPKVTKRGKKSLEKSEEIVQEEQKTTGQTKEADDTIDAPNQEDEVITHKTTRRGKKPVVKEPKVTKRGKKSLEKSEVIAKLLLIKKAALETSIESNDVAAELALEKSNRRGKNTQEPVQETEKDNTETKPTRKGRAAALKVNEPKKEVEETPATRTTKRGAKKVTIQEPTIEETAKRSTRNAKQQEEEEVEDHSNTLEERTTRKRNIRSKVEEVEEKPATHTTKRGAKKVTIQEPTIEETAKRSTRNAKQQQQEEEEEEEEVEDHSNTLEERTTRKRNIRSKVEEVEDASVKKPIKTRRILSTKDSEDLCFQQLEVDVSNIRSRRGATKETVVEKPVTRRTTRRR